MNDAINTYVIALVAYVAFALGMVVGVTIGILTRPRS